MVEIIGICVRLIAVAAGLVGAMAVPIIWYYSVKANANRDPSKFRWWHLSLSTAWFLPNLYTAQGQEFRRKMIFWWMTALACFGIGVGCWSILVFLTLFAGLKGAFD